MHTRVLKNKRAFLEIETKFLWIVQTPQRHTERLRRCLTESERYWYMHVMEAKRHDWLLGRYAAKQSVRAYLARGGVVVPALHSIEIRSGNGQPPRCLLVGHRDWIDNINMQCLGDRVALSIGHSRGVAIAQVISRAQFDSVGVDVERVRSFHEETARAFLTRTEYEAYSLRSGVDRNRYATMVWCIKEAYLKAIGTGLRVHPRRVDIEMETDNTARIVIRLDGKPVPVKSSWTIQRNNTIFVSIIV